MTKDDSRISAVLHPTRVLFNDFETNIIINKVDKMQYSQTNTNTRKEDMSQVTMRKGFWFYFEHEGHDISVHGSAWSGKDVTV